jgi:hypothetical protein
VVNVLSWKRPWIGHTIAHHTRFDFPRHREWRREPRSLYNDGSPSTCGGAMSRLAVETVNPYAPPQAGPAGPPVPFTMISNEPAVSVRPRIFEVGLRERHAVEVRINVLTGQETYLVDGEERLRTSSWWGRRCFSVGEKETHDVEVRVAASGRVSVYVDRQLAHHNLFPALPLLPLGILATLLGLGFFAAGAALFPYGPASALQLLF